MVTHGVNPLSTNAEGQEYDFTELHNMPAEMQQMTHNLQALTNQIQRMERDIQALWAENTHLKSQIQKGNIKGSSLTLIVSTGLS